MGKLQTESSKATAPENLFRNRAFLLLWAAYGVSAMGDHISEMAVLKTMDALESTAITRLQATMTFMFMAPFFFFGPFSGILADRLPRRGVMIAADLIRMVIMFNFGWLLAQFIPGGESEDWSSREMMLAFAPLLIVGIFAALFSPARLALLPTLIRDDQLVRANAMTSGLGVISSMFAVALGGYLAKHYDPIVAFTIDAGTFAVSAMLLVLIRLPRAEQKRPRASGGLTALAEGISYTARHRRVMQLISIAVVVWMCGSVVRSTIPAMVLHVYDCPDYFEMTLFQARLGLGMLSGAIILVLLGDALRSEIAITWALGGLGFAIGVLTLTALVPMPARLAYHLGGLAVIFCGVFGAAVMASYNALMQRIIPNRLRGRVFGLTDLTSMAALLLATGLLGIPKWERLDQYVGWILLGVTIVVLSSAVLSLAVRLRTGRLQGKLGFWWNVTEFYCKWWFRLKREGLCTVPPEGAVIVVANHTCSIDPLLLIAATPNRVLSFVVAAEFSDIPIAGRLTRMIGCIPVRRDGQDAAGTRIALRHLKEGNSLGIFIQGGIVPPGETREPKDGAAMLALHTGALVVPAHISGTIYDEGVARSFFRRHRARVRFGKPIDLSRHWIPKADKEALSQISRMLMDRINELGERED